VFAVKAALEKRIEEMQFEVAERSRLLMLSQAELTLAKRQLEQQLHVLSHCRLLPFTFFSSIPPSASLLSLLSSTFLLFYVVAAVVF